MESKTEAKEDAWGINVKFAPVWDAMIEMEEMAGLLAFCQTLAYPSEGSDLSLDGEKAQIVTAMNFIRERLETWSECLRKAITDGIIVDERKKHAEIRVSAAAGA